MLGWLKLLQVGGGRSWWIVVERLWWIVAACGAGFGGMLQWCWVAKGCEKLWLVMLDGAGLWWVAADRVRLRCVCSVAMDCGKVALGCQRCLALTPMLLSAQAMLISEGLWC